MTLKRREPRCLLHHESLRNELKRKRIAGGCPACGWGLLSEEQAQTLREEDRTVADILTVGELKRILANVPDEAVVELADGANAVVRFNSGPGLGRDRRDTIGVIITDEVED